MFPLENVDFMSKISMSVRVRANKTHSGAKFLAVKDWVMGTSTIHPDVSGTLMRWVISVSGFAMKELPSVDIRKTGSQPTHNFKPQTRGGCLVYPGTKKGQKKTLTKRPVTLPPAMPPVICWVPRTWKRGVPVLHNNGWRDPLLNLQDLVGFWETKRYPYKAVGRYDKTPQLFEGTHFFRLDIHKRRNKTNDDFYKCSIYMDGSLYPISSICNKYSQICVVTAPE